MVAPLAKNIIVYTNGDANVTGSIEAAVKGRRVTVEPRRILSMERKDPEQSETLVHFEDGGKRTETFMVSNIASLTNIAHSLTLVQPGRRSSHEVERTFRRATWS